MKREELKALGLEDDKIESIMQLHGQSVQRLVTERDNATAQLESANASLAETKTALEAMQKDAVTKEDYNAKVAELTETINKNETDAANALKEFKTQAAFSLAAKGKIHEAAQDFIFNAIKEAITYDNDGNPDNVTDVIQGLEADKYGFAMIVDPAEPKGKFSLPGGASTPPTSKDLANDAIRSVFK